MPEISRRNLLSEQFRLLVDLVRWIPVASLVGAMGGTASAILLASLTLATNVREQHIWLIFFLAPAGWSVGLMYKHLGKSGRKRNNLILEQVHDPQEVIPVRMTPLILIGTFVSHLFGGSAGREGTAIQTAASLADQLTRPLRLSSSDRRILLMAGISAGFASVFGTPLAGAVFGIEVLAIGKLSYDAIAPCFLAAFIGDLVTRGWANYIPGIHHTIYRVTEVPALTIPTIFYAGISGIAFGLMGMGFAKFTHIVSHTARRFVARSELRPVVGGLLVTTAVFAIGYSRTARYIGLGLPTIQAAFQTKLPVYDFAAKFLFTSVTLVRDSREEKSRPCSTLVQRLAMRSLASFRFPPLFLQGWALSRYSRRCKHAARFDIHGVRVVRLRSWRFRRYCMCHELFLLRTCGNLWQPAYREEQALSYSSGRGSLISACRQATQGTRRRLDLCVQCLWIPGGKRHGRSKCAAALLLRV